MPYFLALPFSFFCQLGVSHHTGQLGSLMRVYDQNKWKRSGNHDAACQPRECSFQVSLGLVRCDAAETNLTWTDSLWPLTSTVDLRRFAKKQTFPGHWRDSLGGLSYYILVLDGIICRPSWSFLPIYTTT